MASEGFIWYQDNSTSETGTAETAREKTLQSSVQPLHSKHVFYRLLAIDSSFFPPQMPHVGLLTSLASQVKIADSLSCCPSMPLFLLQVKILLSEISNNTG